MRIRLTLHARKRMARRGIGVQEIRDVLENPVSSWTSKDHPERTVLTGEVNGRRVRIVVRGWGGPTPVVITTFSPDERDEEEKE